MKLTEQLAKSFRDVYFGGNWTAINLKETLTSVTWEQATTKIDSLNTIAALAYHMNYYVSVVIPVLEGKSLNANDKYSWDHPPIESHSAWEKLLEKTWEDAENFAALVEQLPESRLWEDFSENKYGNYYRNISGVTEHNHYHMGQIVLIKKLLLQAG